MTDPTQTPTDLMTQMQQMFQQQQVMLRQQREEDRGQQEERERLKEEEAKERERLKEERERQLEERAEERHRAIEQNLHNVDKKLDENFSRMKEELLKEAQEREQKMNKKLEEHMKLCKSKVEEVDKKLSHNIERIEKNLEEVDNCITEQAKSVKENKVRCEEKNLRLEEQIRQLQRQQTKTKADQVTYIYRTAEEMPKISKFRGWDNENPIEFLVECERNMDMVGNNLNDTERVEWIARRLEHTAAKWYTIIRENVTSYADFKNKFEQRYWNDHIQRKIRNQLEFDKYENNKKGKSKEEYVIDIVARAKHLTPKLSEGELVNKLAYHFDRDINVAVMTRGTRTLEELLCILTQWEEIRYIPKPTQRVNEQQKQNPARDTRYTNRQEQPYHDTREYQQKFENKPYQKTQKQYYNSENKNKSGNWRQPTELQTMNPTQQEAQTHALQTEIRKLQTPMQQEVTQSRPSTAKNVN